MEIVKRSLFKTSLVDDVFEIDWKFWRELNQFHLELMGVPVEESQIRDPEEKRLYKKLLPIVRRMNSHVDIISNNWINLQHKFGKGSDKTALV